MNEFHSKYGYLEIKIDKLLSRIRMPQPRYVVHSLIYSKLISNVIEEAGNFQSEFESKSHIIDRQLPTEAKSLSPKILFSSLECPVCLEYSVGFKIYSCRNGHSVCENCQPYLCRCPTCQGPPAKTRNLGLENIAENVVVECPFAEAGCIQYVVGSEYNLHKSDCDLR
jgi:hypothetical protein